MKSFLVHSISKRILEHGAAVLVLLCVGSVLFAQNGEDNIWYFGRGAGLDFGSVPPRVLTNGNVQTREGCAVIADPTGRLLFYTDGQTVWSRNHLPMPNGEGLKSGSSATQAALIIPMPETPERYYVFTTGEVESRGYLEEGLHYSIVDMRLNGGLGDVSEKNVHLSKPACEKLTAVRHCNGKDWWVITRAWGFDEYRVFLLTGAGLVARPVISSVGTVDSVPSGAIGYLKASPDGRRLAAVSYVPRFIHLLEFDRQTGEVLRPVQVPADGGEYGVTFSPSGSKLYVTNHNSGALYQYDVSTNDPTTILKSRVTLDSSAGYGQLGALQTGADGRIYLARENTGYLGVIAAPDADGPACNYTRNGLYLEGRQSSLGLPNVIDAKNLPAACGALDAKYAISSGQICKGSCIDVIDQSGGMPVSWQWLFPGGAPATSTERNPGTICYDSAGEFTVTLIVQGNRAIDTMHRTIRVTENQIRLVSRRPGALMRIDTTLVGATRCDTVLVKNTGSTPLVISSVWLARDEDFSIPSSQLPLTIAPGDERPLTICYAPVEAGMNRDTLRILDNCGTTSMPMIAHAVEPIVAEIGMADTLFCAGSCIDFTDRSSGVPVTWEWSFPGARPGFSQERNPRQICFESPGDYVVTLIVAGPGGHDTIAQSIRVIDDQLHVTGSEMTAGVQMMKSTHHGTSRCDTLRVENGGPEPYVLYGAQFATGDEFAVPRDQFPLTIPPRGSRTLVICYTPSNLGEDRDTLLLTDVCSIASLPVQSTGVAFVPVAGFDATSRTQCEQVCIDFTDTSANVPTRWEWSFPGGTPSVSDMPRPTVCYEQPGDYPVTLTISNIAGTSTLSRTVSVATAAKLQVGTALTAGAVVLDSTSQLAYRCDEVVVMNAGGMPFHVSGARLLDNTRFSVPPGQFPFVVPPGERRTLQLCYSSADIGEHRDTLIISDSCSPIILPLVARGRAELLFGADDCGDPIVIRQLGKEGQYLKVSAPFPNPGALRIALPVQVITATGGDGYRFGRCELHDLRGTAVATGEYVDARRSRMGEMTDERGSFAFDVGDLPQGFYVVTLQIEETQLSFPVLIER